MTENSPINLALKAVQELFPQKLFSLLDLESYTDDSAKALEDLVKVLPTAAETQKSLTPVLIRMGTEASKKRQLYGDLLADLLENNYLGVSGSIHSIVSCLLRLEENRDTSSLTLSSPFFIAAREIEVHSSSVLKNAQESLLNWSKLESSCKHGYPFPRLAGGAKPLLYVFDDYSNLTKQKTDVTETNSGKVDDAYYDVNGEYKEVEQEIKKYINDFYSKSSSNPNPNLYLPIRGFCGCLNSLSIAFKICTPSMKFANSNEVTKIESKVIEIKSNSPEPNWLKLTADILRFSHVDENREQIAAFIIDLEWLPEPELISKWDEAKQQNWRDLRHGKEELGHIAVRLLSQRYPEIPCFVFTGMWSFDTLQKSLASGAAWCFQKPVSHHKGRSPHPDRELQYFDLEQHLTDFADLSYATYDQLLNENQFDLEKLEKAMSIRPNSDNFKHLIARLFTAEKVEVVKVMGSGKSGAAATFFVCPTSDRLTEATRFVKIGSWLEIQKEYAAYQQVIKPKLNNHVARIIQPPAVIPDPNKNPDPTKITWDNAGIVSSLAGFPESYDNIQPLETVFDNYIAQKDYPQPILDRILETIEFVLLPLHQPTKPRDYYFSEEAPCLFTGELIPLRDVDLTKRKAESTINGGDEKISLNQGYCYLQSWLLMEIKSPNESETDMKDQCHVTLTHPKTKARIRLRGQTNDVRKRFGGLWVRLGMPVNVDIKIDPRNAVIAEVQKKLQGKYGDLQFEDILRVWMEDLQTHSHPIELFADGNETLRKPSIKKGKFGGIHGDLNLNNILYPKENTVGFLIDFSESRLNGLAAFDLAWLEAQIWNHYLFPNLAELAEHFTTSSKEETVRRLLRLVLKAMNTTANPHELFAAACYPGKEAPFSTARTCIENSLIITHEIRKLITNKLSIGFQGDDVNYALMVCFFRQSKFTIHLKNEAQQSPWINLLSYLCSTYYLGQLDLGDDRTGETDNSGAE
jgi:hypothetical protein